MATLYGIDLWLFHLGNSWLANPIGDAVFPFITDLNHFRIPYAIILILLMLLDKRRGITAVLLLIIIIVVSDQLSSTVIKNWVGRVRPCHVLDADSFRLLVTCGSGKSFPSSHAVNNFAAAMLFALFYPRARWWLFGYAALVAYSRVYVGVHYPADIAAGALIGAAVAWGVVTLAARSIPAVRTVLPSPPPQVRSEQ